MTSGAVSPARSGAGIRGGSRRLVYVAVVLALGGGSAASLHAQESCEFVRGDIVQLSGESVVDLNDGVEILAYLYLGVSAPECLDAADVNDNGLVEPGDYAYLVNYLYADGPPPPPPYPDRGTDPTPGVTVPEERDARFALAIGQAAGVPSYTGIEIPLTVSADEPFTAIQAVVGYNQRDDSCPDLLVQEIRTEEGTLLSTESAEYIIAEFDNAEGLLYVAALKDFATPFWFQVASDPSFPAGDDQLLATIVVAISSCADYGFAEMEFVDGREIPNDNLTPPVVLPEAHNLVVLGDSVVRPQLGEVGGVEVRVGFIRGDANYDDHVDVSDPVFLLDYVFRGGPRPPCQDAADTNNDTRLDISDPIFLLNYLFTGGPQPSEPFPQAGVDPSDDGSGSLGCDVDA